MTNCLCEYKSIVSLGGCIKMVRRENGTWYLLYSHTFAYDSGDNIKYCPICGRKLT